ncbi:MAG TPA: hypothetical protein VF814_20215 [Casimicrobiaceae bacterium]
MLDRLAGVQSGANPNRESVEAPGDAVAHHDARAQRKRRRREREHEAVTLRLHHVAAMLLGGVAHDPVVPGEQARESCIAQAIQEHGRRFDVAEHDRHRAVGRRRGPHVRPLGPDTALDVVDTRRERHSERLLVLLPE